MEIKVYGGIGLQGDRSHELPALFPGDSYAEEITKNHLPKRNSCGKIPGTIHLNIE